ncbi:hypothetical protein GGF42_003406 [Coemansia sp. RSA 2424]|nr:hypothetical protein GGF42_003406 [Coemansia sp. RSA 2424]
MEGLVPRQPSLMVDSDFCMPYADKSPQEGASALNKHLPDSSSHLLADANPLHNRAYDTLSRVLLEHDPKWAGFIIGILMLSLLAPQYLDTHEAGDDMLDKSLLVQVGYEACLGALTIIRVWLSSKEEHRPLHILDIDNGTGSSMSIVADYLNCVYDLLDWLASDTNWDKNKLVMLYNALLVHRVVMRLYRQRIPYAERLLFMARLQKAEILFLSADPQHPSDVTKDDSLPNRALIMLTEVGLFERMTLPTGAIIDSLAYSEIVSRFKSLYSTHTVWTIHLNVWCNVLRALTIARGRHILKVDERVLVQESMFSGQRQRKGLSKVDEYIVNLQKPTHHLEPNSSRDSLETSTPFSITSMLLWDTMRMVFTSQQQLAQEEQRSKTVCIQSVLGSEDRLVATRKGGQLAPKFKTSAASVYALVAVSGSKSLHQYGNSVSGDLLKEACLQDQTPPRVLRNHAYFQQRPELNQTRIPTSTSVGTARRSRVNSSSRETSRLAAASASSSAEHSIFPGVYKMLTSPFRKKPNTRSHNEAPSHLGTLGGPQLVVSPASTSLTNAALGDAAQFISSLPRCANETAASHTQARQQPATLTKDAEAVGLARSSESMISMQLLFRSSRPLAIGPATLTTTGSKHSVTLKSIHHQPKNVARVTDIAAQKTQVARLNSAAAISFLDTLMTRVWQFEAAWTDFHISDFVGSRDNPTKDLQKLWLVWVGLLGSPVKAQVNMPVNIDQIQVFLVECDLLLSLGISGARMLMYSLDLGIRRIFLESSMYDGVFPEPAICGAATLLASMVTILSCGRVLSANHVNPKIRPLTDSNMAGVAEYSSELGSIVDRLERTVYPTIADPLAAREYSIAWKEGGPIFGRSCETMFRILLDRNCLKYYGQKCSSFVEHAVLSGLSIICLTELNISDKR